MKWVHYVFNVDVLNNVNCLEENEKIYAEKSHNGPISSTDVVLCHVRGQMHFK
jgi:hypothetical protein